MMIDTYDRQLALLDEILVNPRDVGAVFELRQLVLSSRQDGVERDAMLFALSVSTPPPPPEPLVILRTDDRATPLTVECSTCLEPVGLPCVRVVGPKAGDLLGVYYHLQRRDDARKLAKKLAES
jgi:hypothetical protein